MYVCFSCLVGVVLLVKDCRMINHYYSEDQYAVSIKEDTAYPCLHSPKTTEDKAQYAVSRETQYAVFKIWNEYNILEDIKRGPYSKKSPIRRIQLLGYAVLNRQTLHKQEINHGSLLLLLLLMFLKTAKQLAAKRNQERVKSILLLAIPDEYLLKFHNVPDAKSLWAAIKSRFGGNEESKKMQKNVLKHQFENFTTASNESLDKAYDRFQKLISQLEVHGAPVSKEDINQKFLRSLPPSWSQIALIMRNKPDIDQVDIDDLYNNLRVYEDEMKKSSSSISNSQNLAFLSSENTSSTNEATSPPLDNEDLQQIDQDDLEELDVRQQVAMLTVRCRDSLRRQEETWISKENNLLPLISQKLSATTVKGKGTLLRNADQEETKGKDLMMTMAGGMQHQMNLHHKHWWLKMV
ncbi:hypothetical protein Tco_0895552 [Tanacetum coccineum]|uniref:Uncharacterized protein n=1 Tax=Tanacetum coccineum TaxID=301880 RepID=A0ABQ5CEX7_9ASTR